MPGNQEPYPGSRRKTGRLWPVAPAVLAMVALAAILASACGSDSSEPEATEEAAPTVAGPVTGLSMEDYYARLQAGFDRLRVAAENTAPRDLTSTDQLLPFLQASLTEYSEAMTAFADDVESLNPPQSIAGAHEEFASALRADAKSTAELAVEVRGSDSLTEATEAFASRETTLLRAREPCRALQDLAVQAGLTVSLPCDE